MFYSCSSLKSIPDISNWSTENIKNLDSIFEKCSSLSSIPNISKWKLNENIKINNIFKECNSLLVYPNLSKWNINISEYSNFSCSNNISIKAFETNSLISENIKFFNSSENSSNLEEYIDIKSYEENNFNDNSVNELVEFYEDFYNQ